MKTAVADPVIKRDADTRANNRCRLDEEEVARRIEKGIDDAKAAISEKLEDGKAAAERFLRQRRYAVEDGLRDLAHKIKRHPISFLGIAFAAGAAVGLLLSHSSSRTQTKPNQ